LRRICCVPAFYALLILLVALATTPVWAHAVLMESSPRMNATVKGPDVPIKLRFNVRVDGKRSRLQLTDPDGNTTTLAAPKQTGPDTLESHASGLKPGDYKLVWRALAADGHMSNGEVDFTVN
jgi:copper resistance protein C